MRKTMLFFWVWTVLGTGALAQAVFDAKLTVETVVSGIPNVATSMAFIGADDFLICEKNSGRVRRVTGGVLQPDAVLDLPVNTSSERGLLGLTLDPQFLHNGYVYVYLTEADGVDFGTPLGNRVYRYTWDGSTLSAPLLVLDLPVTTGPNHDGGVIDFGPDDKLYAIIGDLNRNGQLQNFENGPPPDDTAVILRTDRFGNPVADNPFYDPTDPTNALGRYYAYGVRNSFGFTFDPLSGSLWQTENGPAQYDEVNRFDPGSNSGWEMLMGPDSRDPQGVVDLWLAPGAFYVDPQFSWLSTVAPTAIAFAESPIMGCNNVQKLFVGDNNCGQLYRFTLTEDRLDLVLEGALLDRVADTNSVGRCTTEQGAIRYGNNFGVITDIENGPDGSLYVVSASHGAVYRIVPVDAMIADVDGDHVEDSCDCATADAGAYGVPTEVPRLRVATGAPTWLGWDPQAATAGSGTAYTMASGDLAALRAGSGFAGACALGPETTEPQFDDLRANPAAGDAYYYLVRAGNACDPGTYGDAALTSDPRDLLDAVLLPFCER